MSLYMGQTKIPDVRIGGGGPQTAVLYTEQNLEEPQKEQARKNIDAMSNVYLKAKVVMVDDVLPGFDTAEEARQNVYSPEILNTSILAGNNIVFTTGKYYAFSAPIEISESITITSTICGKAFLYFDNSEGFLFNHKVYLRNITFKNLSIESKLECFKFYCEGNRPYNIFEALFEDLYAYSKEKNCFEAYNNRGVSDDWLMFNDNFNRITVNAPNGSGFSGISRFSNVFSFIRDYGSIKNIFLNCEGRFVNCNTSFAGAEYFLLFDGTIADYAAEIYIENTNMEDLTKGALKLSPNVYTRNFTLKNSAFKPKKDLVNLAIYPYDFGEQGTAYITTDRDLMELEREEVYSINVKAPLVGKTIISRNKSAIRYYSTTIKSICTSLGEIPETIERSVYNKNYFSPVQLQQEVHSKILFGCKIPYSYKIGDGDIQNLFMDKSNYCDTILCTITQPTEITRFNAIPNINVSSYFKNGVPTLAGLQIHLFNASTSTGSITLHLKENAKVRGELASLDNKTQDIIIAPGKFAKFVLNDIGVFIMEEHN